MKRLLTDLAWDEIVRLALLDRRIFRILLSLLYDADDHVHWLAVDAIGRAGGAMAEDCPEKTRDLIRRLLWILNEESGGTPWGATGAIGAIVAARPDLFAGYLSMINPGHDDAAAYPEFIWALAAVGRTRPDLSGEYLDFLIEALGHTQAVVRGYAAWCLGLLGCARAAAALARLAADSSPVAVYQGDGVYRRATVAAFAADSLDADAYPIVPLGRSEAPEC